ncbi:Mitochondrial calcium uniporter regulator 1 [Pitangus sulphuratus]|nr:Mitochondrial calcium uniporter regulator 1 [Pitangus sulphuratus]
MAWTELCQRRFRLDIRGNFFTEIIEIIDIGMGCPGRWWSHRPCFEERLDLVLSAMVQLTGWFWVKGQVMKVHFFSKEESVDLALTAPTSHGDYDVSVSASPSLQSKGNISLLGNRRLFFDTHALVCLLEENGFTTQQSEVIVSALVKIMDSNLDMIYKDMVTKVQQEIALQQVMSHIGGVKKDMIILEKSEFSALRSENEKIKLELQQIKKQVMDEITKVRADNKLNLNLEKSRVKELYSLNERKLLEMRTEIVELHAQQDRALTQTDRKIDTEVADLKTMLESHKLDNIKYLAGEMALPSDHSHGPSLDLLDQAYVHCMLGPQSWMQ